MYHSEADVEDLARALELATAPPEDRVRLQEYQLAESALRDAVRNLRREALTRYTGPTNISRSPDHLAQLQLVDDIGRQVFVARRALQRRPVSYDAVDLDDMFSGGLPRTPSALESQYMDVMCRACGDTYAIKNPSLPLIDPDKALLAADSPERSVEDAVLRLYEPRSMFCKACRDAHTGREENKDK